MNRLNRSGDLHFDAVTGRSLPTQQTLQASLGRTADREQANAFSFFFPAHYEENYRYPLVVWLHEDGGSQRSLAEIMPHISTQNFLGVGVRATRACDTVGHRYQWLQSPIGTAVAEDAVFEAINTAQTRYSVNPDRVYLAGYREGGTMALRIGLRNPGTIDGVVSIDGALPRGGRPLMNLAAARNLAILSAVAIEGKRYPMDDVCEDIRLWHAAGLRMDMRQYTVDDSGNRVMRDVNRWIMGRVTGQNGCAFLPEYDSVPVEFSTN